MSRPVVVVVAVAVVGVAVGTVVVAVVVDVVTFSTNFSCTSFSTARWKSYRRFNTDLVGELLSGLAIRAPIAVANLDKVGVNGIETEDGNRHNVEIAS